nr:MAG TPA: hypothetical protein [Caudoviricetes sp.]
MLPQSLHLCVLPILLLASPSIPTDTALFTVPIFVIFDELQYGQ